jgi:Domain of unknown function (DUF2019)
VKNTNLGNLTIAQLVERFAALGIDEDKAVIDGDNAKYRRLYWQMDAVEQELKRRPGDQRRALLPLFDHPNLWVRLMAAKTTLAVAPEAARQMLEAIVSWGRQPYAGDAGMCLVSLVRELDPRIHAALPPRELRGQARCGAARRSNNEAAIATYPERRAADASGAARNRQSHPHARRAGRGRSATAAER